MFYSLITKLLFLAYQSARCMSVNFNICFIPSNEGASKELGPVPHVFFHRSSRRSLVGSSYHDNRWVSFCCRRNSKPVQPVKIMFVCLFVFSYGDKSPKTVLARLYAIVWMLVGMILVSITTAKVSSSITTKQLRPQESLLKTVSNKMQNLSTELKGTPTSNHFLVLFITFDSRF